MTQGAFDDRNKGQLLDDKNRGRLIVDRLRQSHRAGRRAFRAEQAKAPDGRAPGASPQHQAVVKVVSWGKSSKAATSVARYITRTRPKDAEGLALPAITPSGQRVAPADLARYLDTWSLIPDAYNLSKEAQALSGTERLQLPEKDRLDRRQIGHMILSIPAAAGASPEQVDAIARDTLQEVFASKGVEYIYVVHTDHSSRPHAHAMFMARNGDRQIRLGPEDLRIVREIFAEKGRDHGIALVATAREDRAELAKVLEDGKAQVRPNRRYIDAQRRSSGETPWLATRAPLYHARHGAAYQQRFIGSNGSGAVMVPPPIALPAMPNKQRRLIEHACKSFADPAQAQQNFSELYAEAPAFALWAMNNRPEVIGSVRPQAKPPRLYLRKAERRDSVEFDQSPQMVAELNRMMSERHGPDWKGVQEQLAHAGDPTRDRPIFKDMWEFRKAIDRDPQFNQSDPFDGSLKAWRQAARVALSTTVDEPRQVVAARAAAEQSARQAVAETKRLRAMETNQLAMYRAVDRFGTDQLKPATPVISSRTIVTPQQAPAAEKELPTWLNRMFGRRASSEPGANDRAGVQPVAKPLQTEARLAVPEVKKPAGEPSQHQPSAQSPRRRDRSREDDRGRD